MSAEFAASVDRVLSAVDTMLRSKNEMYGNSALDPCRVFSAASPTEQLLVRIDDKLSRIRTGNPGNREDTVLDLIGYLVLLKIMEEE
jgi:hypothetical protein